MYRKRTIEVKLLEYIKYFSSVAVTGPRQSGKSTLLTHCLHDYRYVTFDDAQLVQLFYADPVKFMRIYDNKVIFDEAQKVPEIFNYVKIAIDQDRNSPGKFILTGSSQFSFIKGITESLAGRIGTLNLLPYQLTEIPKSLYKNSIFMGGYPELVNKKYQLATDWFGAYVDTYLQRDVRSLSNIGNLRDFLKLVQLLAANTSQVLNLSTYAKLLGVDIKTIKHWISILEASYIIFLLPPFYENFGKRVVKHPKLYFYDTGLVSYLTGITSFKQYDQGPMAGALFENYIIAEIVKRELHNTTHANLYYLRTHNQDEIDLIIDRKQQSEFIEIKHNETFRPLMLKTVEKYLHDQDQGRLLYTGKTQEYLDNIKITNYQEYLLGF